MSDVRILRGERIASGSVSATRTGTRTFEGRNNRGAVVQVGPAELEGVFTPGELLKIALAACGGMSADKVISRRLGDDFAATYWAHGLADPETNRYTAIDEEAVIEGIDALSAEDRAKLIELIERSIERACTVARSVEGSIDLTQTVGDVASS